MIDTYCSAIQNDDWNMQGLAAALHAMVSTARAPTRMTSGRSGRARR